MSMNKRIIAVCASVAAVAAIIVVSIIVLNHKTYTVNFYSDSKQLIKIETVQRGHAADSPNEPSLIEGRIFTKWSVDFSKVKKNLDVYPEYEETADKKNVVAMSGAYGKTEEEVFIPLKLCGDVCLSGIDLTIDYDADALEFVSVYNEDGALVYNADEKGKIRLNYISVENTEETVDLCGLKFRVKAKEGNTQIKTTVEKVVAWDDADKLIEPEYTLIDSTVFVIA